MITRLAAILVLGASLLASQLAFVIHQLEHLAGNADQEEICAHCLAAAGGLDQQALESNPAPSVPAEPAAMPSCQTATAAANDPYPVSLARGPPLQRLS